MLNINDALTVFVAVVTDVVVEYLRNDCGLVLSPHHIIEISKCLQDVADGVKYLKEREYGRVREITSNCARCICLVVSEITSAVVHAGMLTDLTVFLDKLFSVIDVGYRNYIYVNFGFSPTEVDFDKIWIDVLTQDTIDNKLLKKTLNKLPRNVFEVIVNFVKSR